MPRILSDGYTIELPVIASLTDFLGYAHSTNATTPVHTTAGQEIDVPTVSPQFRVQQSTNSVNLLDGQTLVFALKDDHVPTDAALMELDGSKSNLLDRQTLRRQLTTNNICALCVFTVETLSPRSCGGSARHVHRLAPALRFCATSGFHN
jgi:hypothetical protein